MMREIKFRFTFKNGGFIAQRFATLDELLDDSFPLEKMEEDINAESGISDLEDFPEYEVFKDEYIGAKDKNDIEIYEGDIVPVAFPSTKTNAEVIFHSGTASFMPNSKYQTLYNFNFYKCEVIGNIYKNEDLLK